MTGPIDKGLAAAGLLSHVIVSKYVGHLPLERQSRIFIRQGLSVSPSTLCDWVGRSMELLKPIAAAIAADVLASKVIQTDDTPVRVLEPGSRGSHTGRVWVYVGDAEHAQTAYEYTATREQKWAKQLLGDYEGYVQADAYPGYDVLFVGGRRLELGCWMHARRYFFEVRATDAVVDRQITVAGGGTERALRGVAVWRKNYLFFGSKGGGERAAVAYTLIESCRRSGVEPWAYPGDVLGRVATHPADWIGELMPRNWNRLVEATESPPSASADTS